MRKVRIANPTAPAAGGEVAIVLSPAKVVAVRWLNGDPAIKDLTGRLEAAKYNVAFPSGSAANIAVRASVFCTAKSACDVVLHSVEANSGPTFVPPSQ